MADLFQIVGKISLEGVDKAEREIQGVTGTAKQSSGIFGSVGGKIATAIGTAFATHKIIGFGKDVVSTTQSFSDSMKKVQSLSGASGQELQKLNDTALKYGSTTAWTSSQVADGMGYMALAGFNTNQIISALPGTLGLASASGTDLARASDILTDALTAFGYEAKDATLFADVLATTQAKSNTTVDALGEAFKYAGTVAGTYKYKVEDVSTALGLMANAGVKGTMAGTAFSSIISRLGTNTSHARDTLEKLGVQFFNADGTARDLGLVLTELADKTKNMTVEQKANIAKTIAGQEAQKGLLAILNQGSGAYKDLQQQLLNCGGTASDMSKNMESGIGGAIRTMQSALEGFKIKLGQKFEPYLTKALQEVAKFVTEKAVPSIDTFIDKISKMKDWFSKNSETIKDVISVIGVLTSAIIAFKAGAMIQSVVQSFQSAQVALSLFKLETQGASIAQGLLNGQLTLGQTIVGLLTGKITLAELATGLWAKGQAVLNAVMSANPIALVVMAIGALIAIFVVAYNRSETFRNAVNGLWEKIKEFGSNLVDFFKDLPDKIGQWFDSTLTKVTSWATDMVNKAKETGKNFVDNVVNFVKNLPENIGYLIGFVLGKVASWAVNMGKKAKETGKTFVNNVINFIKNLPSKIQDFIEAVILKVKTWSMNMGKKAKETGRDFVKNVIDFVKNLPSNIATWLTNTINKLTTFVTNVGKKAKEAGKEMLDNVVNGIKNLPSKIASIGSDVVNGLWNGITGAGKWLKDKISGFCDGIIKGFKKGFDIKSPSRVMRDQVGKNIALGIIEGVDRQKGNAKKSAKELSELYVSSAKSKVTELKKANKLNEAQEVEYWNNILKHCVKGTNAYKTATNQMTIAKNNLNNNIKKLDKQYSDDVKKVKSDLIKSIQDVTDAYDKAVKDRQSQILSSLNLFNSFEADDPISKMDLTNNLKSQVLALKEWDDTLDELSKRKGVDTSGLLDDLENMGVKSLATLKELNSMSDEELAQYVSLYRQKNAVALERSEAEHKELKKQSEKQIKELTKQANNQLNALEKTYVSNLKSMGATVSDKSVSIGKDIVNGLKKGISSQNASFQTYLTNFFNSIVSNAKNSLQIKSPSRVFRDEVGKFISEGIGVGIAEDDSPENSMRNKVDSILGIVNNADTNIKVGTSVDDIITESPLQKYQLDFNAQLDSLNDGFDRLLALIGQYLPNIADNMDRNIVLDGNSLVVGMSRRMDAQLGKMSVAKGRGNV